MSIHIFVLNGSPRSGKDTFCALMEKYGEVEHYSYVDFTRYMLSEVNIDYHKKTDKDRQLLETINNALEAYDDIPMKDICESVIDTIGHYIDNKDLFIFVDIRKPDNIKRFLEKFPEAKTVYIDDGKELSNATESDHSVKDYDYDYYIVNNGSLDDLQKKVGSFVHEINSKGAEEMG